MPTSYHYSAISYLDQWLEFDRKETRFFDILSATEDLKVEGEALVRVGVYYGVIRNFKTITEPFRLSSALHELKMFSRPKNGDESIETVTRLADALGRCYGPKLTSAASKFLWMRFKQPIVVFDSLAAKWLARKEKIASVSEYGEFYRLWKKHFPLHVERIRKASLDIFRISKFIRPHNLTESELEEVLGSSWFLERVFDHYICNDDIELAWKD